jgi:SAM-dependent methyltransferase
VDRRQHWESVYRAKGDTELSWFQARPGISLGLIDGLRPLPRRVLDVGGGQSALAGELVRRGIEDVAVLDVSSAAIERGKQRLGPLAERVRWIVGDVLEAQDLGEFDLWHDRAAFHFLTTADDRRRYAATLARAVCARGHAIVATFALSGPEQCSGLAVCRYDAEGLAGEFGAAFRLMKSVGETHTTPRGKKQDFTYVILERAPGA